MDDQDFRRNPRTALLFDAADLLERRAERCIPGPWVVDGRDVVPEADEYGEIATCRESSHDEADWIAMMDPRLAAPLARHMREEGRELYFNESMGGNTPVTQQYTQDAYGDLLEIAVNVLKRAEIPWSDLGDV